MGINAIFGWLEGSTASSTAPSVTKAASTASQHIIFGISGGYSAAGTPKTLTVATSSGTLWTNYIDDTFSIEFPAGVPVQPGRKITVTLGESTAAGTKGHVWIHGKTQRYSA